MRKLNIAKLDPGHAFGTNGQMLQDDLTAFTAIPQYELTLEKLSDFDIFIIPNFVDQEHLYANKEIIEGFLAQKKIVVFCGHLFRPFIPNQSLFMPQVIRSYKDYEVFSENSPIFNGVETEDMTLTKGVAGFFARGYYHTKPTDEKHLTFGNGHVVTYVDRETTAGTIIMHAGRDLFGYQKAGKTTDLIRPQFVKYLQQEVARLQEGK